MTSATRQVQGTVRHHDAATRTGSVLLDDGVELAYDRAAFDAGGLRLARAGQRVRLEVVGQAEATRVVAVHLVTL